MSLGCQTDCSLDKRKIVSQEEDKLSEPNIKREVKDKKEVFINKKYLLPEELVPFQGFIERFWANRKKLQTIEVWKWQIDELLKLKDIYGDKAIESQLQESINKGWNSIEVSKYEKFNNIERKDLDSKKRDEKRLENMKIHIRMLGENSSWFYDKKYGEEYRKLLFDRKN